MKASRGIKWPNGDEFNADDIMFNIARWCGATAAYNSVAARMGALVDAKTKVLREGGIERIDDHTVRVNPSAPDISPIAGMSGYQALIMHRSYNGSNDPMEALPVTAGPCGMVRRSAGVGAEVRRKDTPWRKGEFWLGGVQWFEHGADPAAMIAALESDEVDATYETKEDSIAQIESIGVLASEIADGATIVIRTNADNPPYDDVRVRQAFQCAVDNNAVLQLSIDGAGREAENHHIGARCMSSMRTSSRTSATWRSLGRCWPRPARPAPSSS